MPAGVVGVDYDASGGWMHLVYTYSSAGEGKKFHEENRPSTLLLLICTHTCRRGCQLPRLSGVRCLQALRLES